MPAPDGPPGPGTDLGPDLGSDLALLTAAAEEAGALAMGYQTGALKVWDKGPDDPVTEADLAVDALLKDRLLSARADYGWLSEESTDTADRLDRRRVFVVDPIDGTRAYAQGGQTYAVAAALIEEGRPVAGVVHMPARAKTYAAAAGLGATLNGAALRVSDRSEPAGASALINKSGLGAHHWTGPAPEVEPAFRPSLAYRICLVAEGRFDAVLTLRAAWEWDTAAGALIAAEAGAAVTDADGAPIRFNAPKASHNGLIAAPPALHAALMARRRIGSARPSTP